MQSKCADSCSADTRPLHLYEYAVVQYIPSIERGEVINIGLIMMCKRRRWVKVRFDINEPRIYALCATADTDALRTQLTGFERVADGHPDGGTIAALEPHERFRWLTAVRSACLQTSRPHAGLTPDLDTTFNSLFSNLVL